MFLVNMVYGLAFNSSGVDFGLNQFSKESQCFSNKENIYLYIDECLCIHFYINKRIKLILGVKL